MEFQSSRKITCRRRCRCDDLGCHHLSHIQRSVAGSRRRSCAGSEGRVLDDLGGWVVSSLTGKSYLNGEYRQIPLLKRSWKSNQSRDPYLGRRGDCCCR